MEIGLETIRLFMNIALVIVGTIALWVYWLQEYHKKKEAATMIVLQIKELWSEINRINNFKEFETNINLLYFYEHKALILTDYWNQYKHLFVRKMDVDDYQEINNFYKYIWEMDIQRGIIQDLIENTFFQMKNIIAGVEQAYLSKQLSEQKSAESIILQLKYKQEVLQKILDYTGTKADYVPQQAMLSFIKVHERCLKINPINSNGYAYLKKKM
ncbi:hypothetical protein [Anaerotignum lactatifermentans]|uniref:hypothetical protein n=1 Tax=Anaerotignum lactatifermentans TaxID=160404 RepID=UPI0018759A4B|nr:hypothetical protein [Anaerotignum lactatifermentans]MBE5075373.1 hypothetical protein [Anaerotignum lactatifermentans]